MRPVTASSINNEIKRIEDCIVEYQNAIKNKRLELTEKKRLLKKLEKYQATPIEKRTLICILSRDSSTVKIMDNFERLTELGFRRYARLIIELGYETVCVKHILSLVVEHEEKYTKADIEITMTELKNRKCLRLFRAIKEQIEEIKEYEKIEVGKVYVLENPIILNAQNSRNRSGYGNRYNGYELIRQGTLYGETTEYLITGFILGSLYHPDFIKE